MIFWASYVWPLLWLLALSSVGVPRSLVRLLPTSISFTALTTNQRNLWGLWKEPNLTFSDPKITMPILCVEDCIKLEISPRGFVWIDGPSNAKRSWPIFLNITEFKWLYLCTKNLKEDFFGYSTLLAVLLWSKRIYSLDLVKMFFLAFCKIGVRWYKLWRIEYLVYGKTNLAPLPVQNILASIFAWEYNLHHQHLSTASAENAKNCSS